MLRGHGGRLATELMTIYICVNLYGLLLVLGELQDIDALLLTLMIYANGQVGLAAITC